MRRTQSERENCLKKVVFKPRSATASDRSKDRIPVHPGAVLRERYLLPRGITADDLADAIGVYDQVVHQIITGRAPVTYLMAGKLARHLGTTSEFWIKLQSFHDSATECTTVNPNSQTQKRQR